MVSIDEKNNPQFKNLKGNLNESYQYDEVLETENYETDPVEEKEKYNLANKRDRKSINLVNPKFSKKKNEENSIKEEDNSEKMEGIINKYDKANGIKFYDIELNKENKYSNISSDKNKTENINDKNNKINLDEEENEENEENDENEENEENEENKENEVVLCVSSLDANINQSNFLETSLVKNKKDKFENLNNNNQIEIEIEVNTQQTNSNIFQKITSSLNKKFEVKKSKENKDKNLNRFQQLPYDNLNINTMRTEENSDNTSIGKSENFKIESKIVNKRKIILFLLLIIFVISFLLVYIFFYKK